jgi:hypothetical protein
MYIYSCFVCTFEGLLPQSENSTAVNNNNNNNHNLHLPAELLPVRSLSLLALAPKWAEQLAYVTSEFHEENATVDNTAGGAPRTSVRRLCEGFLYLRNITRFYPTQADVIFVTAIR